MRTPKAFANLQPRVARASALPWVSCIRIRTNPEKGCDRSSKRSLNSLTVSAQFCGAGTKRFTQPFQGYLMMRRLLPRVARWRAQPWAGGWLTPSALIFALFMRSGVVNYVLPFQGRVGGVKKESNGAGSGYSYRRHVRTSRLGRP